MSTLEHGEQVEFVRWFRASFPDVRIIAIPNGGKRDKRTAAKLKEEGVTAGVPDLYVPAWNLWIEMKRLNGGVISDEQSDWLDHLQTIGHGVILANGWIDGANQVKNWLRYRSPIG